MHGLDLTLFRLVNEAWANPLFDVAMPLITNMAKHAIGIVLLATLWLSILIFFGKPGRRGALLVIPAVLVTNALADLGKANLGFLRPCVELSDVRVLGEPLTSGGMPSAHAANMAAAATVVFGSLGRKWWPIWILPLVAGFSRVYIGVHYPSQVGAGWLLGIAVGAVFLLATHPRPKAGEDKGRNSECVREEKDVSMP